MHLIGRWARVRGLGAQGWASPWMLDRKWRTLSPFRCEEWWRSPNGHWIPVVAGGIGFSGSKQTPRFILNTCYAGAGGGVQQTVALDSNYVAGTGGDAIGTKIYLPVGAALTLNNIYFFITGFTGTAANVNDINYEVRTGTGILPTMTAPGLVTSGTKDPSSATGWINISGLSQSLSATTIYWIIVGDADGNGTDYATVLRDHTNAIVSHFYDYLAWSANSTADGWGTRTSVAFQGNMVLVFSNGSCWGQPFSAIGNSVAGSTTNRRGLYLSTGLTEAMKCFGWVFMDGTSAYSGIEIYDGATNPGGSTLAASTNVLTYSSATSAYGALLATPYTLAKSTPYRVVLTYSGNNDTARKMNIGTGTDANLRGAMMGGGGWYWAEANGTTNWANDDTSAWPCGQLLIEDQIAVTGVRPELREANL